MKICKRAILFFLCASTLGAKDVRVKSMDALRKKLASSEYSIAVFYNTSRENMRNEVTKQKIKDLETMFKSMSKDSYYKDAKLQFIRADVDRRSLQIAPKRYNLTKLPAFVIFLGRQPLAALYGYIYRQQIDQFIAKNLKSRMDQAIKQANELRKKELEKAKIRAYNRPYWYGPYWYGGFYPYWWYGPGWRPYYRGWYW